MIFDPGFRPRTPGAATIAAAVLLAMVATAAWPAEPQRAGASAAAQQAARQFLCPHGGSPSWGGRCRPGSGGEAQLRGWDRGLPPAAHVQAGCPPGTQAEPALGAAAQRCRPLP